MATVTTADEMTSLSPSIQNV